jgi:hypothetical protein
MRNYMKNKNEYIEDGKRYIEDIKSIDDLVKHGEKYVFYCKIHQRGSRRYQYIKGDEYIEKADNTGKKLWLDSAAMQKIEETIAAFDEAVDEAVNGGGYTEVWVEGLDGFVYYRRVTNGVSFSRRIFDVVMVFPDDEGVTVKMFFKDCSTSGIVSEIYHCGNVFGKKTKSAETALNYILHSDNKTIAFNPLYLSAVKENDKMMQCELKLLYRIADEDECRYISEKTGVRILPSLTEKYDRNYVISVESILYKDYKLLIDSGYRIAHRPYFAMMGHTHYKYQLNPHTKSGVDAAEQDAEAITFDEFLALFDEYEKSKSE